MRHDIALTGHAYRLRPIDSGDAAFAAALRADAGLSRFIHGGDGDVQAQQRWLQAYFERPGDHYFVIESVRTGDAQGLVSVYDLDAGLRTAEWGRWILRHGSMAAPESAWLIYRVAFDVLNLDSVYCRTVAQNKRVVSFHNSCGIRSRRTLPAHFTLNGEILDAVEHRVERADWPRLSKRLEEFALMISQRDDCAKEGP